MAVIYKADLSPTKPELVTTWLDAQGLGEGPVELLGGYRFDDPDGAVGVEALLARRGAATYQLPLTYRDAPLLGAEDALICTMEHSVLGRRWIYDATGDPVYARVLASVLLAGVGQADELVEGADAPREPSVRVTGSGSRSDVGPPNDHVTATSDSSTTLMELSGALRVVVRRRLVRDATSTDPRATLTGTWSGLDRSVLLAYIA
jgi:hypothetical protein